MPPLRVLFVPCEPGVLSHVIPLIALSRMLKPQEAEHAFLVPRAQHALVRAFDVNVLDIDHKDLTTQMVAHGRFRPQVVVYDCSLIAPYATRLSKLASVSIMRTGSFPHEVYRSSCRAHSMGLDIGRLPDFSSLGLRKARTYNELFQGDVNIIPALPSVEPLAPALQNDPAWVYAGPLLVADRFAAGITPPLTLKGELKGVESFFEGNMGRKVVYVTLGAASPKPGEKELITCMSTLLADGFACITNLAVPMGMAADSARCLSASYLPMNYLCTRADVIVHHCGSGAYHYPLMHGKPAITIGTNCVDREEVALRLAGLGVSRHLPAPSSAGATFGHDFRAAVDWCLDPERAQLAAAFEAIGRELAAVRARFNLVEVLEQALAKRSARAPR